MRVFALVVSAIVAMSSAWAGEASVAGAAPGDDDPAWSANPLTLSYPIQVESSAQVVRDDGSAFIVGEAVSDALAGPVVTKVGPGGLDTSFGVAGSVRLAPPNAQFSDVSTGSLDAVAQPGTGRVVIIGQRGGMVGWTVVAMTSTGELDPTFGTAGSTYLTAMPGGYKAAGYDPRVLAGADGSLFLVGYVELNQFFTPGVLKLTPNGAVDVTFGQGGLALAPLPSSPQSFLGSVGGAVLDAAGRIVATGLTPSNLTMVIRWSSSGVLDPSFDGDGVIIGSDRECGVDVAVDTLDRVVVACSESPTTALNPQVTLVRYLPNGAVDRSYGDNGIASVPPRTALGYSKAASIVAVGDAVVVAGTIGDGFIGAIDHQSDVGTWRFTPGGQLDRSFGSAGGVIRDDVVAVDLVKDVVALPDGRLQVLTTTFAGPTAAQTAVFRFRPATVPAVPSVEAVAQPERLLDTRIGLGAPAGKVGPADDLQLTVVGVGLANVPADATAVAMNVTATATEAPGFLTVYPCGTLRPVASNLNFTAGDTIPNLVVAKVGAGGRVRIHASSPAQVIADVVASYGSRSDLHPLDVPTRRIDTTLRTRPRVAGTDRRHGARCAGCLRGDRPSARVGTRAQRHGDRADGSGIRHRLPVRHRTTHRVEPELPTWPDDCESGRCARHEQPGVPGRGGVLLRERRDAPRGRRDRIARRRVRASCHSQHRRGCSTHVKASVHRSAPTGRTTCCSSTSPASQAFPTTRWP